MWRGEKKERSGSGRGRGVKWKGVRKRNEVEEGKEEE